MKCSVLFFSTVVRRSRCFFARNFLRRASFFFRVFSRVFSRVFFIFLGELKFFGNILKVTFVKFVGKFVGKSREVIFVKLVGKSREVIFVKIVEKSLEVTFVKVVESLEVTFTLLLGEFKCVIDVSGIKILKVTFAEVGGEFIRAILGRTALLGELVGFRVKSSKVTFAEARGEITFFKVGGGTTLLGESFEIFTVEFVGGIFEFV